LTDAATPQAAAQRKWRPTLSLVVFLVLASVLSLPLFSLYFLKIYQNQLIQHTEAELIAETAALAATFHREIETALPGATTFGARVAPASPSASGERDPPIAPTLDLANDEVLGPRPEARPATAPIDPAYRAIGQRMLPDLAATQAVTLAGFRLLDFRGTVIGGREEIGLSLADVEEIAGALQGHFRAVLRQRISKHQPPPLTSVSRGTAVRIFVAVPVVVRDQVAGVVYASRTPRSVLKHLYEQRSKVVLATLFMILPTLLLGFVLHRTITAPMRELIARTDAIGRGERDALRPLRRHGTREFARLSNSFFEMARGLSRRSEFISTFAAHVSHELKSPLTSIQGAAELLRDDIGSGPAAMTDFNRRKFLDNIIADTDRLAKVAGRLREFARAENPMPAGHSSLRAPLADLKSAMSGALEIAAEGDLDTPLRMSDENIRIVLSNLADNAARHGATRLGVAGRRQGETLRLEVADDGEGVSVDNRPRIFDSFFTTRRERGGTGMGLAIVRAMLGAHGGSIRLLDRDHGAAFEVIIPVADGAADGYAG
jgi:signal transduction histidine kinase